MRISFYLDKPDAARTAVMLNVAFAGKRLRFGTGLSVLPQNWNSDKQEPRVSDPNRNAHRKRLAAIETKVNETFNSMNFDTNGTLVNNVTIEEFRNRLQQFLASPKSEASGADDLLLHFTEFADTYTVRTHSGMITANRPGDYTVRFYRKVRSSMQEWSTIKRKKLTYDDIDEEFYSDYCRWLSESCQLADTTISNYIKVLKTFLKWARRKTYHNTSTYETFSRSRQNGDTLALSVDEIRTLRDIDLSDTPRLERVRDNFLLQCFTGMRYGDLVKLEPRHFDDEAGVIRYVTQKTDTKCIIPLIGPLVTLLQTNTTRTFDFLSDVKQNMYLKEVAERAGLVKQTTISQYRAGKRVEITKPKFDLITTHVARRSYVSTSIRFGIPEAVISIVTGHSAKGMLQQHYIKLDEEAVRDIVVKGWEQL